MNWTSKLKQELAGRQALSAGGDSAGALELELDAGTARCDLEAVEPLASVIRQITLTSRCLANAEPQRLKEVGDDLSRKLTYLLEPIRPIEVDEEEAVVQLRSDPPGRCEERHPTYYELLVRKGGSLELTRYRKTPGEVRQRVGMQLTHEVLQRVLGDFQATLV